MILFDGPLQVVPQSVTVDAGTITLGEETQDAVVQSYSTESGVVQIILPVKNIKGIIKGLEKVLKEIGEPISELEVVGDLSSVSAIEKVNAEMKGK